VPAVPTEAERSAAGYLAETAPFPRAGFGPVRRALLTPIEGMGEVACACGRRAAAITPTGPVCARAHLGLRCRA
jgi:hypothetical protein